MTIRLAQKPFLSVQGEGPRTGKLTIFVRFFGCNLRCPGFFQSEPTKPETYIKPILVDPKSFKTLEEFPVVEYGCDTLYAIDPKFKHLAISYASAAELVSDIVSLLPTKDGVPSWTHPHTFNAYDICFTGGEPMLQQDAIAEILEALANGDEDGSIINLPTTVQFETNGTKELEHNLDMELKHSILRLESTVLFNVSPKLYNVSGEPAEKSWNVKAIESFAGDYPTALKFVVNETDAAFNELDDRMEDLNMVLPIYIMPVGSSQEQQSNSKVISAIAKKAIDRGYHVSGRLHCILFGNSTDR